MILYGLGEEDRATLLQLLSDVSLQTDTPFRIQTETNSIDSAIRAVQEESGIAAVLLGVDSIHKDKQKLALRLGRLALQCNRDHYVVYIVKNRQELELVLPLCARCAGVLVCPLEEQPIRQVFKPLFEDYQRIYQDETSANGQWINLKSAGKVHRIRLNDVIMIQSVGKMIEFHSRKQDIAVYSSMENVEKMLTPAFLRCHRSYFVNTEQIQYVDFREMTIHLTDGSVAPLSRSFKDAMDRAFSAD